MLLTIRVILTILFSAFVLWSQTPAVSDSWKIPVPAFPDKAQLSEASGRFIFRLNLPPKYVDARTLISASNAAFFPESRTVASQAPASRPKTISYSNGYIIRQKIHKYASIATLPLAISEIIVGEKLDDSSEDDSLSSAHSALAAGIGVLFGVESVTGVWNMWEAGKNPSGRGKRLFHGILMLAADAGFVATAALAPNHEDDEGGSSNDDASTHRAVAYASLGAAAVSYVYMLFAR